MQKFSVQSKLITVLLITHIFGIQNTLPGATLAESLCKCALEITKSLIFTQDFLTFIWSFNFYSCVLRKI